MSQDTEPKRAVDAEAAAVSAPEQSETRVAPELPKTVSLKLSSLVTATAAVLLIGALITVSVLWMNSRSALSDRDATAAAVQHAEQVATDYSVGASNINFSDLNSWTGRLKANTTPRLADKFDATAAKLQEILVPLKWTSSATPVTAKVMSHENGVYLVNVFLNVTSTNAQNPQGVQTTVTYNVTVDPSNGWKVADVGGMNLALPKQ
ncbi:hypothetical protein OHB26_04790 [Nocardia sp. NBC_01503]|uniref:hypothetical protein n=1 Tax=Nocardia sp. NBC_01503 TaxID=2975997 RepID=UPI002E7ABA26|nr:hypothetical protein [Nocardia sp. NBC_01503]WTL33560.1 hypothetical protein OHB26_04790 [Nocardia sp. NBC_01503]